ncbi:hypothetical protein CFP56_006655 [Quercus suber]|uniref:Uncharacterized protein n=1 Tax=Quercus suber TaxID=58331 RepID=A0AAW0L7I2_QUESU
MNSWMSIIGNTKYKFFHIGGPQIARRVWRDYGTILDWEFGKLLLDWLAKGKMFLSLPHHAIFLVK